MNKSDIIVENIKEGNIYYFKLNKKYFFFQVLKIVTDLPAPYNIDFKFGYYIAIFQKTFIELPKTLAELDLSTIYITKHYWKNSTCYFSLWNKESCIKFYENLMSYELKDKYKISYFGNYEIQEFDKFKPPLVPQFSMPSNCKYHNGVKNSHSPVSFQAILTALEFEEKERDKKRISIKPIYFKEWSDYIISDALLKTEKAILQFQQKESRQKTKENALKKCIETLNKIDEKYSHIGTIERDEIYEKLLSITSTKEIDEQIAVKIIEKYREW